MITSYYLELTSDIDRNRLISIINSIEKISEYKTDVWGFGDLIKEYIGVDVSHNRILRVYRTNSWFLSQGLHLVKLDDLDELAALPSKLSILQILNQ